MDKEDVVHIYNRILLSLKRNEIVSFAESVVGPRNCHTEWSKSEREKQTSCNTAYLWNLEKWYRWTYLQSRNRDTENKHVYTKEGRQVWDELGNWDWYIQVCAKSLGRVWLCVTLCTVPRQAPLSMGFSRQEYWSGVPGPPLGDLPYSGVEPGSPTLQADSLPSEPPEHIHTAMYKTVN